MNTPTRFTIRWDDTTLQYKVSKPNLDYMEVVSAQDYDETSQTIEQLTDSLNQLRLEHERSVEVLSACRSAFCAYTGGADGACRHEIEMIDALTSSSQTPPAAC